MIRKRLWFPQAGVIPMLEEWFSVQFKRIQELQDFSWILILFKGQTSLFPNKIFWRKDLVFKCQIPCAPTDSSDMVIWCLLYPHPQRSSSPAESSRRVILVAISANSRVTGLLLQIYLISKGWHCRSPPKSSERFKIHKLKNHRESLVFSKRISPFFHRIFSRDEVFIRSLFIIILYNSPESPCTNLQQVLILPRSPCVIPQQIPVQLLMFPAIPSFVCLSCIHYQIFMHLCDISCLHSYASCLFVYIVGWVYLSM